MLVIAFHTQHDANLAVSADGQIQFVLELERLFEERYFASSWDHERFRTQWTRARGALPEEWRCSGFDVAVTNWVFPSYREILKGIFPAREWTTADHHVAHAMLGFYDSPFRSAIVLSFDGGGNDGCFRIFRAGAEGLEPWSRQALNFGAAFRALATAMPEVTGRRPQQKRGGHHALAGKIMGYAAHGAVRESWLRPLREYYATYQYPNQALFTLGERIGCSLEADALPRQDARDLAATSQRVLEDLVIEALAEFRGRMSEVEGIVMTGGCALNVGANQCVAETFGKPVHVPPAPNDAGIAVGSIWARFPPRNHHPIEFLGFDLVIDHDPSREDGRQTFDVADIRELASLLVDGKVIGVARGRSEVGPRALGNRSILCLPSPQGVRDRLNRRIKFREWFRPFAPVVPCEFLDEYFEHAGVSPYMSFAPRFRDDARRLFPAVVHADGSGRVQTVEESRNPWLHALLTKVKAHTGHPVLLNTSFNTKGRPLLGRSSTAFDILDETDLDGIVIGDRFFGRRP